ncbi:MAG: penicillin-binding protein 2 [Kiloniellales bacterium]|nr:penicillin-binding protein 2 [Kiloniellales bacterium]
MALMHEDHGQFKSFSRRALLLGGGKSLLLGALVGRMYYLQVVESDRYTMLAEDNRINMRLLPPPRGRIVDRFGVPLAVNLQNYRLVLVREQTRGVEDTLDALSEIVEISDKDRLRILRETSRKRAFVPVTVRDNLTWSEVSRIEVNAPDLPGVTIDVGQTRHYPAGNTASQVLGYVAAVSESELTGDPLLEVPGFRIGKNGIERRYDLELRGAAGASQFEVNAVGRVIRELSRDEGEPGRELVLTLDAALQNYAHQRLMGERAAAAVVMDIERGDVLALASVPSYDPNPFSLGMTAKQWSELINDPLRPLNNRAVSGLYAPGSTYKMIVALAALEAGIGPGHRVYCPGFMRLGNARFHCWKKHGHGWMDMRNGIKQSCDVYFYEVARRAGIDRISAMSRRFGLGAEVGIDLYGEKGGMIPTRDWKLATFGEPWQGGETLVTAIGQGFVLSTPLQLAVMTARLASGKAVTPRLVRGFKDALAEGETVPAFEPMGLPEPHLRVIRDAMDATVNERRGTAYGKRITEEGWEMAGKTGTSQVRRITMAERLAGVTKNEDLPWRRRDHALFVCYAPVHAPRYCAAVIVEHGGGGSKTAAPIAKDIMLEVQRRDPSGGARLSRADRPAESEG